MSLAYEVKPLFIPSPQGDLFALYYVPGSSMEKQCIIHIPAFAEEMNRSRRMVATQSRAFAQQGYSVLVLDLFGTGDSQGDFSEATWQGWMQSIGAAYSWLEKQGIQSVSLWGLRTGVLLLLDFIEQTDCKVEKIICWQPVLDGEMFVMQFLRLRVAAGVMDKNLSNEKTADLKRLLLAGERVEVAGYLLNPDLVIPLINLKAEQLSRFKKIPCFVFTVAPEEQVLLNSQVSRWVNGLEQYGVECALDFISGDPFWSTPEITVLNNLIELTIDKVCIKGVHH